MDHEEGFGGSGSVLLPVREAQPVVPQADTLDERISSSACGCIPSGTFRRMDDGNKRDIESSQRDISDQQGQGPSQSEAQIRAYFLTIVETPRSDEL